MADNQNLVSQVAQKFAERRSLRTKPRVKVAPDSVRNPDDEQPDGWCAWPCRDLHAQQSDDAAPAISAPRPNTAP